MEFKVSTDLTTALPKEIVFNFEDLKAELTERLSYYQGMVITEDSIKEGKDDRAKLNKLRLAVDGRRKEVKNQYMAPYNAFEGKVKEVIALIDKPIAAIDGQLAAYEEKRREEKQKQIAEAYEASVPEQITDIIPLARIQDPKWLNATTSMKKIEDDLIALVKRTNADMLALDTVEDEYAASVRETYIRTLDIEKAMSQKEALREAAEAFRRREEEKAKREAERQAEPVREPEAEPSVMQPETETIYSLRLEFQLTLQQSKALKKFLTDNHINYFKI